MDSSETSGIFDQQEEPKRQTTPKNRSSIRTIGRRFFSRVIGSSSNEVVDHASGPSSWQGKGTEQLTNIMSPYDSKRSKLQASVPSGLRSRFDDGSLCKTMTKEYRNLSIPSLSFSCGTYSSSASDQSSPSLSPLTPAKLPCKPEESAEDPTDISAKRATAHRSTTASSFSQHEPQGNNHQVSYEKDYDGFEVASYKTYQDILPFSLTPSRLSDQSLGNPRRGASSIGPQQSHDRDERRKKRLPCSEDPIEESDTSDDEYGHENEEEQKLKPVAPLPPIRRHTTVISSIRSKMRAKVKSNEPRASIGEQRATTDSVPNHSYKDYKKPVSSVCLQKQRKEKDAEEDDLPLAVLLEKRSSRTLSAPTMASAHVSARLKQQQPLLLQQRRDSLDRQTAINRESEQLEYQRSLLKHARERRRKTQHPHVLTSPTYGAGEALLSPQHKSRAVRKSMVQSFHKDLREDVNTRRREVARPEIARPNYLMTRDQRPKAHSALSVPTLSSTCDGEDKSKPKRPKHPRHSSCSMLGGNIGSPKPQQAQMGPPRLTTLSGCPSAWGSPKTSQPSSTFSNRKSAPLIPQSMPFYSPVSAPALPYQSSISFPAMQNASFRYSMPMVAAPHFFYSQPQHPFQLQHHRSARSISNVACTPTALAV